jgi:acyl carrier protein
MKDHLDDVVRRTVARHVGVDHAAIDALQHLQRDLHLQPLDIVLIVLAIEDAERIELPIAHLESNATVGGLTMLVRRVCAGVHHAYRPAFVPIYRRYRRSRRFLRRAQEV